MSIETDFRARALAAAPVAALVAGRVALSANPQDSPLPLVVYGVQHAPEYTLNGTLVEDRATIDAECWAGTAAQAEALADALVAAVVHTEAVTSCWLLARAPDYDPNTDLHVTTLRLEWCV
jgi:hypothetical protein